MRLFVDDMSGIGHNLDKAQQSYQQAMKKLAEGRGNLIAQSEAFKSLGVEVKRPINPQLVQQALPDEADEHWAEDDAETAAEVRRINE